MTTGRGAPVWVPQDILIAIRTYPTPARKGIEVSCTAGITAEGKWIRLFPVPYRLMPPDKRFSKYQWVRVNVTKASSDTRPESHHPDVDTVQIVTAPLPTRAGWQARKDVVFPLKSSSLCELQAARKANRAPTLGLFKPKTIAKLTLEPDRPDWTEAELARLRQTNFFQDAPVQELQKIPFKFRYHFTCDDPNCQGHALMCTDWEMGQSYRSWRQRYGPGWEAPFRQKYEHEMIDKLDTHFYVGTIHGHPGSWIIVGLFYPPHLPTAADDGLRQLTLV